MHERELLGRAPRAGIIARTFVGGLQVGNYALEDLPIRTKTGTWSTATQLRVSDSVVVKAYRDGDGNYIAQTIRIR